MNRAKAVRIFMYSLLVATLIGVAIFVFFIFTTVPTEDPVNPTERPLNLTKSLLDAASDPKNLAPPTTLPADVKGVGNRCWIFLKTALAKNKNQYQLDGRLLPDNTPTGADWVVVDVIFADGTKAETGFYNAFLTSCAEVKADDRPLFSTLTFGKQ